MNSDHALMVLDKASGRSLMVRLSWEEAPPGEIVPIVRARRVAVQLLRQNFTEATRRGDAETADLCRGLLRAAERAWGTRQNDNLPEPQQRQRPADDQLGYWGQRRRAVKADPSLKQDRAGAPKRHSCDDPDACRKCRHAAVVRSSYHRNKLGQN
jgi:hypothetical protein